MTEMWNPYSRKGEKPFQQFNTWGDFLEHYAVPKNEIIRKGGPGDAIQAGEWYLTKNKIGEGEWFISYVGQNGKRTRISTVPYNLDKTLNLETDNRYGEWWSGDKDGWGDAKYHYKVDIEDIFNFDFLNWKDDPFEIK